MTPTELAQLIIDHAPNASFESWLVQLRPQLSLDVVRQIIDRASQQYLTSARKALDLALVAQQVAHIMASPEAEALAAWSAGGAYHFLCHYQEALNCFRKASIFYTEQGRNDRVIPLNVNQVTVLQNLGHTQEAIDLGEATRPLCLQLGENGQRIVANLEMNLGSAYRQAGQLDKALQAYRRAYQVYQTMDDAVQIARTEINQALILEQQAEFAAATKLILDAKEVLSKAGQTQEAARAELNLGVMTYRQGQYQKALFHLETAQQAFTQLQNPTEVAIVKLYRSFVYRDLGLARETITLAQEAEEVLRWNKHPWSRAWCLLNQAAGYRQLERYAAATDCLKKARRILRQLKAQFALITLDMERAELALQVAQFTTAQRITRRLLHHSDIVDYPILHTKTHLMMAQTMFKQGVIKESLILHHIEQAQAIAERQTLTEITLHIHSMIGSLASHKGEVEVARVHFHKAIAQIDILKGNIGLDELRIGFMDDKLPIYRALLTLEHEHISNDQFVPLFQALHLAHTAPWPHFTNTAIDSIVPDETHQQIQALRQRWHWLQSRLELPGDLIDNDVSVWFTPQQTNWQVERQQVEEQLAETLRRRRIQQVGNISFTYPHPQPDSTLSPIQAIQNALQPGQLFLFYYLLNHSCHVIAITAQTCHHLSDIASMTTVQRLLQVWQFHITAPDQLYTSHSLTLAKSYLGHLHNAILRPLVELLAHCSHLFLVLPMEWQNLPIAACYEDQQYLIERMAITHLTTSTSLTEAKQILSSSEPKALVLGCSSQGRLPFAVQEAQQITDILTSQWSTQLLTENRATVMNWRELSLKSHLIHLATHATFRPDNPFFSWIELADERLTVADLYETAFTSHPLIVLSACETGRGVPKGGGLLGLARALFAAGASGLILSHWQLEDESTLYLMIRFYKYMIEQPQSDPASLLRQAQIAGLQQYPHPFFWAGHIYLQG